MGEKREEKSQVKRKTQSGSRDDVKSGAKRKDTERVKKRKSLKPIRKQSQVAGNDDGTHEGENMNVISSPLSTEENVWKRLKREYTAGYLGRRKMKKIKIDYNKNGGGKNETGEQKKGVATSALLLFWQVCPRELPQWQNTEWHVSCWQFCQHRILRYRSKKSGHKTGSGSAKLKFNTSNVVYERKKHPPKNLRNWF